MPFSKVTSASLVCCFSTISVIHLFTPQNNVFILVMKSHSQTPIPTHDVYECSSAALCGTNCATTFLMLNVIRHIHGYVQVLGWWKPQWNFQNYTVFSQESCFIFAVHWFRCSFWLQFLWCHPNGDSYLAASAEHLQLVRLVLCCECDLSRYPTKSRYCAQLIRLSGGISDRVLCVQLTR